MRYVAQSIGAVVLALACATTASAQATRTWVSGVGDDANPCSRTAPCKTFAGAISKTAVNGLINCIDPGGFGAVTITKAITIDCRNTQAGVLASGINGIVINGPGIVVNLRGLSIEGATTGLIGISFIQGSVLNIQDSIIFGFGGGSARGLSVTAASPIKVSISDTTLFNNGTGLHLQPAAGGTATVALIRVKFFNNGTGILSNGTSGSSLVLMHHSAVTGNTTGCSVAGGGLISSFQSNVLSGNGNGNCTPTNSFPSQ